MLTDGVTPDYKAVNIKEAVNIIKKHLRSAADEHPEPVVATADQTERADETDPLVPEVAEQDPQPEPQIQADHKEPDTAASTTDELLRDILAQLKSLQREEMFHEFSVMR
ncbi:MAG: hypothetical protein ACYTFQ_21350, partial [Planctomycetota bacterium]